VKNVSEQLLAKVRRPEVTGVLMRSHLFDRLDAARKHRLIWISGPPGSGKTTLISSYITNRDINCLWYQVDEGDEDIAGFFHYLGLAVQRSISEQTASLAPLTPEYLPGLKIFARRYFEQILQYLKPPAVLVMDNYQEVAATASLHAVIRGVCALLPPDISLIIISRTEPPPIFARLRIHEEMTLIGWDKLRLTLDEAHQIAVLRQEHAASPLSDACVERCYSISQGWMAGLVLLMEQNCAVEINPASTSSSTQQLLFDYFAGELFERKPPAIQAILLKTAFLPNMTARLAEEITGDSNAGQVLAALHQNNFFITRREKVSDTVYEYHPLFRDFLWTQADKVFDPEMRADLCRRAGAILFRLGQNEEAVRLYREAGDWDKLGAVISSAAPELLGQGRHQTLAQWLNLLPTKSFEQDAWLLYWRGMACLPFDQPEARGNFERAFTGFGVQNDPAGLYLAWSGVVETFQLEWQDFKPLDQWIAAFERLEARHPEFPSPEIERRVYSMLATLCHRQPQHPKLPMWTERGLSLLQSCTEANQCIVLGVQLLIYYIWIGDLLRAGWVIDVLRRLAQKPAIPPLVHTLWCVWEAMYFWCRGEHRTCLDLVAKGLEVSRTTDMHAWDSMLLTDAVYGSLVAGELEAAESFLRDLVSAIRTPIDCEIYHLLSALVAQQYGDFALGFEHARQGLAISIEMGTPFPQALNRIILALLLFERGEDNEGTEHLGKARAIGRAMSSRLIEYLCLLTEAKITLERGQADPGLTYLRRALTLSRECGGLVVGWWGPQHMARLYVAALEADIEVPYVQTLIRRMNLTPPDPENAPESWPWPVRIYTLGRFEILIDGEPLRFSGKAQRKPLELLKALIALGGEAVPESRLCDVLWPESDGDSAHRDFAVTLHRLRRLLKHEKTLRVENSCLSLDPRYIWLDSRVFERRLGRHETDADGLNGADALARALRLYEGPLFPQDHVSWLVPARDRLQTKFLRAAERLAAELVGFGACEQAVDWYLRALEIDPLAEGLYRSLMRLYDRTGRRAEALSLYARCRQTLLIHLGVSPTRETQELYQRLIEH
jgi:LuxR family maltose regulon positive regulatory protein